MIRKHITLLLAATTIVFTACTPAQRIRFIEWAAQQPPQTQEIPAPPQPQLRPGVVTHYGESYQGQQLGCPGSGLYDSRLHEIIAANPSSGYSCGDKIVVTGPAGTIIGWRVDTCPGCGPDHLDLSEAGIEIVCGGQFTCDVEHGLMLQ